MSPSIFSYEKRPKKDKYAVVEWLFLIVITVGAVLFVWDLMRFPEQAEGAPIVDDSYICSHLEEFDIDGQEAEIIRYCAENL